MFENRKKRRRGKLLTIIGACFILMISGFVYSYYSYLGAQGEDDHLNNPYLGNQNSPENSQVEPADHITAKVTPSTALQFTTLYSHPKCGHKITEEKKADDKLINMAEEDLEDYYKEWDIVSFSQREVILFRELKNSLCTDHYMLKDQDGKIAIFKMGNDGEWKIKETTPIVISSLRAKERDDLKSGIILRDEEEVNRYLEHFGS